MTGWRAGSTDPMRWALASDLFCPFIRLIGSVALLAGDTCAPVTAGGGSLTLADRRSYTVAAWAQVQGEMRWTPYSTY